MFETLRRFVFRNRNTGELRQTTSYSQNSAARLAGIDVPHCGQLLLPWEPWECWDGDTCVWHYGDDGLLRESAREAAR